MPDVRIVSGGQNNSPIVAGDVRALQRANAQVFVQVNASGDIVNPGGAGGVGSDVNVSQINGQTPDMNTGNAGAGTLRAVLATDQPTIPVSFPSGVSTIPPVTGVQIVGGGIGRVSISGDSLAVTQNGNWLISIGAITVPVGITGDVSTIPKPGQVWPVREQNVIGVQVMNPGGSVAPSGDFPVRIGAINVPVGVTGDVSTIPKAGSTWPISAAQSLPVSQQGPIGVQILGGNMGGVQVQPSGDFPVRVGAINVPVGVTGDVSTIPKVGQTWPVSVAQTVNTAQQAPIGVQLLGGSMGARVSISGDQLNVVQQGVVGVQIVGGGVARVSASGDLNVIPSATNFSKFPVSGDQTIRDGADGTIRATVKSYANSNPVAVALVNASGDVYSPTPREPICKTIPFIASSNGTLVIAGPYNGRVIKVSSYDLQGASDIATSQGHFGSQGSGSQISPDWIFGVREGVSKQVSPLGGGYIFKTLLNQQLVFELSAGVMRGSVTFHTGDSF